MSNSNFFKTQTPSSRIKAKIVAEYFPQYCKILLKNSQMQIRYLDLFSGPGIYEDGNFSTPLLIAKACAENIILRQKVLLLFNDNTYSEALKQNLNLFFPEKIFTFKPRFGNKTVGEDERIKNFLINMPSKNNSTPTLLFFDPWGYKGIDTIALSKFLDGWGNEIFLFVNTNRINAAIDNNKFDDLMSSLFPHSIDKLRADKKYKSSVYDRLNLIVDNLAGEFKACSQSPNIFHCAFKFQDAKSTGTSHFILHLTKHPKGYELIKQVYYEFDNIGASLEKDGVYAFDAKKMDVSSFNFSDTNIDTLANNLEKKYKNQTITSKKLFEEHHTQGKYCGKHYVMALRSIARNGKLIATYTDGKAHKVSVLISDYCELKFI